MTEGPACEKPLTRPNTSDMERLIIDQILQRIQQGRTFEAVAEDYSFTLKIDEYVHYVCGAVHDGHHFRKELWENCRHTAYDRWYEEDPCTLEMIRNHPIVIAGCDSRFEYDLNREPEIAIYEDAWGKELWREPLSDEALAKSMEKHNNFYRVVRALIEKLESMHPHCVVYDVHSYNWQRWNRAVPTWNIGTDNIDQVRFEKDVESWRKALSELDLPHEIPQTSLVNDTFFGNGYFLKFISKNFKNTLVLATEVAKIYCDELEQRIFPEVVKAIQTGLEEKIPAHAEAFKSNHSK